MSKQEFLFELRKGLSGLPKDDIEERLAFYTEMIDDRIEEGLTEDAAVSEIGSVDKLVSQIVADTPLTKLVKEKITTKKMLKVWEIVLLVLGCPIWISLIVAVFAIILALYASVWSLIISIWIVFTSLGACALSAIVAGIGFSFSGTSLTGIAVIGAGFVCAGLFILMFFVCKAATKGFLALTKKIALGIKNCLVKKEEA